MLHAVLHTVVLFGTLGVVEAVQSAHKVAGDAADALKAHTLAVFCLNVGFDLCPNSSPPSKDEKMLKKLCYCFGADEIIRSRSR